MSCIELEEVKIRVSFKDSFRKIQIKRNKIQRKIVR